MKRVLVLILWAARSVAVVAADIAPSHQQTSPISGARVEVLQSTLAAKWTFRLDRYAERVWQRVRKKDDDNAREEMPLVDLKVQASASPRFQLFTSGLAVRHTFLIDGDTGKAWLVVTSKRKQPDGTEHEHHAWQPFAE